MTSARLDCTYEEKDNQLTILYNGSDKPLTFDYHFEKKILIITDEAGNDNKFTKGKGKRTKLSKSFIDILYILA